VLKTNRNNEVAYEQNGLGELGAAGQLASHLVGETCINQRNQLAVANNTRAKALDSGDV
jgi:hypothetical protein